MVEPHSASRYNLLVILCQINFVPGINTITIRGYIVKKWSKVAKSGGISWNIRLKHIQGKSRPNKFLLSNTVWYIMLLYYEAYTTFCHFTPLCHGKNNLLW